MTNQPIEEKCKCRCHLPLVTTHLCPSCFDGCSKSTEEKCRKVAEKIVDLTGYGQALHVNDILPDLRELIENLLEQEKKRMSDEIGLSINDAYHKILKEITPYDPIKDRHIAEALQDIKNK